MFAALTPIQNNQKGQFTQKAVLNSPLVVLSRAEKCARALRVGSG